MDSLITIATVTWTISHTCWGLTVARVLCSALLVWSSGQPCEVDIIIVVCFTDGKLRHREVKAKRGISARVPPEKHIQQKMYVKRCTARTWLMCSCGACLSATGPGGSLSTKLLPQKSLSFALKAFQWNLAHPDYLGNLSHFKSTDYEL